MDPENWSEKSAPMFKASNIQYEIDKELELLKRHLPYHESDHVANIAYNNLAGSICLQNIELWRNDDAWLNALGAEIIPDPTTAGDFLRRFSQEDIITLMDVKNTIRKKIWKRQPNNFKKEASLISTAPSAKQPANARRVWTSLIMANGINAALSFLAWMPGKI